MPPDLPIYRLWRNSRYVMSTDCRKRKSVQLLDRSITIRESGIEKVKEKDK